MICPTCGHDNVPGAELCAACQQDLTELDRPLPHNRVERSLMEDTVESLHPAQPITLPRNARVAEAIEVMIRYDIGAVLVTGPSGELAGILSERDLLAKVAGITESYANLPVETFMTSKPETLTLQDTLAFALHKMDVGGYRHLPIVQGAKALGIISVRDLMRHITSLCQERKLG